MGEIVIVFRIFRLGVLFGFFKVVLDFLVVVGGLEGVILKMRRKKNEG